MRISPVIPAIVAMTVAAVYGCSLPLEGMSSPGAGGNDDTASVTSVGGAQATVTETATSSTSTGSAQCTTKSECPPDGDCATYECTLGQCVQTSLNEGKALPDPGGNCAKTVCLSGVLTTQDDDGDSVDDGDPCTIDGCSGGSVTHAPANEGHNCGGIDVCRKGICCSFAVISCNGVCCAFLEQCTDNRCKLVP